MELRQCCTRVGNDVYDAIGWTGDFRIFFLLRDSLSPLSLAQDALFPRCPLPALCLLSSDFAIRNQ